jgi:imidazolonepropionase-like amidohydrolase
MSATGEKLIVIHGGVLIDGAANPAVENDALVIAGNRIRSIGPLPEDVNLADTNTVEVIDASGRWIMPGLIDAHTHLSYGHPKLPGEARGAGTTRPELNAIRAAWNAQKVLRAGVTAISVPGGSWFTDVAVREAIRLGLVEGPRVFAAGRMIATYGSIEDEDPSWVGTPDHSLGTLCNSAAEMVKEVRRQAKHGVNFVKMADSRSGDTQCISQAEMAAVVAEAHRRNIRVAIHSRGAGSTRDAALAGLDWIIHADLCGDGELETVAEAGVRIMPTATFVERLLTWGREVGQDVVQIDLTHIEARMEKMGEMLQKLRALGVTVLCGTDSGNYPWMPYGELHGNEPDILVRYGGYTPLEAISCATRNNAFAIGLEDDLGVLAEGKLADVILLDADPVADISVLKGGKHVVTVIKDGHVVDLDRLLDQSGSLTFQPEAARKTRAA